MKVSLQADKIAGKAPCFPEQIKNVINTFVRKPSMTDRVNMAVPL